MAILADKNTRVICQGMTGTEGSHHAAQCIAYGTDLVAGVTPGRGGERHLDRPIFDTVTEAVEATNATASMIFVPPLQAADAILEATDAGIKTIVCITRGIPAHDMIKVKAITRAHGVSLIGPNCPGIITSGESKLGIMPSAIHKKGTIGIVSRADSLTYEAVMQTTQIGLGQTTTVGIGSDFVMGMDFIDVIKLFEGDRRTKGIILVGEIGGNLEERTAQYIADEVRKPMLSYIAGVMAPPGKYIGGVGMIQSSGIGSAAYKCAVLAEAGVQIVQSPTELGPRMLDFFEG
ncbi:MAG: succinate--CoA ligase subunit alpha [Gammaproteobacteria bacterium]|nr:succinate--CoA ligase subunit alpha [Gammaproteobacteria bacterium]MCF6230906.1 succinate--CoA ligase subunit alpha [Gammaproteobacteria bacterium]